MISLKKIAARPEVASAVMAAMIRCLGLTWKIEINDQAGLLSADGKTLAPKQPGPLIWLIWHSRMPPMPYVYEKYFAFRRGAVLTSASRDGGALAALMERFGVEAERGSSSKDGAAALRGMLKRLRRGEDAVFTPDGPRGPSREMQSGAIALAAMSGAPLMPVGVMANRSWSLRSWDQMLIPKPFAKISVTMGAPMSVDPQARKNAEVLEQERLRIERVLNEMNQ